METFVSECHIHAEAGAQRSFFEFSNSPLPSLPLSALVQRSFIDADSDLDPPRTRYAANRDVDTKDGEGSKEEDEDAPIEDDEAEWPRLSIAHSSKSTLEDVGLQVWRGALLLSDLTMALACIREAAAVVELGAGTGLASLACALGGARTIFATDAPLLPVLRNCRDNVLSNQPIIHSMRSQWGFHEPSSIHVRALDLHRPPDLHRLGFDAPPPLEVSAEEFQWTREDGLLLASGPVVFLAADVVYSEEVTESLALTLACYLRSFPPGSLAILTIEKRFNFTLRDADETAPAYDHLLHCLMASGFEVDSSVRITSNLGVRLEQDGERALRDKRLRVTRIPAASIPPRFVYDRSEGSFAVLVLEHINN